MKVPIDYFWNFFELQNAEVWNFGFLIMQNDDSNNLRLRS